MMHRISTTDPISLKDIPDPYGKPYVVEKGPYEDLTIYFENEDNRRQYLELEVEHPISELSVNLDNPTDIMIDEG